MMMKKSDNFSKTIKVGRIASVSDLRTNTTNGRQCVVFTIAINKPDEKPDYYNCIAYNGVARNMDRYIRVGHKVLVIGTESIISKKVITVCNTNQFMQMQILYFYMNRKLLLQSSR